MLDSSELLESGEAISDSLTNKFSKMVSSGEFKDTKILTAQDAQSLLDKGLKLSFYKNINFDQIGLYFEEEDRKELEEMCDSDTDQVISTFKKQGFGPRLLDQNTTNKLLSTLSSGDIAIIIQIAYQNELKKLTKTLVRLYKRKPKDDLIRMMNEEEIKKYEELIASYEAAIAEL